MLVSAENVSKGFGGKPLLQQASFLLNDNDKVGVIGINGTGKSTLLKMLAGLEPTDSGTITRAGGVRIGYLPQNPEFQSGTSVLAQTLAGVSADLPDVREHEAKSILTRLGLCDFDRDIGLLSGGQKKRVAIASALASHCEVLILDEPTNHLDNDMIGWLEEYLIKYRGAILMVTHDRYFLDRVTNRLVEIDGARLFGYDANYSGYLGLKAAREENEAGTARRRQTLLKKELEWAARGPRARGTKSRFRLDRIDALKDASGGAGGGKLELSSMASRLGKKIIEVENVSKGFGGRALVQDFSLMLLRDDRIGIVGGNGAGKTTLLRMLGGFLEPDSGSVTRGETVKLGYFAQECDAMDGSLRVIDYIRQTADSIATPDGSLSAAQMLERFLFPPDLQWNTVGRLSGGERRRLYLLRVLMDAPNILLLDEPTNDLDIETLSILEDYLDGFEGAVIAVSHDRYFLDRVVEKVLAFTPDGQIKPYLGGYTDYLEQRVEGEKAGAPAPKKERTRTPSQKLKFTFKEERERETIDGEIAAAEEQIAGLAQQILENASDFVRLDELLRAKEAAEQALDAKMERWVYLNELAEKIAGSTNQ